MLQELSFDKLCGIAIATLGISVSAFYEMTPIEFSYAIAEAKEAEKIKIRTAYEIQRHALRHQWNMRRERPKRHIDRDKDVELFPWEAEEVVGQTVEEQKQILLGIAAASNKKRKKRKS